MMHRRFRWFTFGHDALHILRRITSHTGRMRPVGLEKNVRLLFVLATSYRTLSFSEENQNLLSIEDSWSPQWKWVKRGNPAYHQLDVTFPIDYGEGQSLIIHNVPWFH